MSSVMYVIFKQCPSGDLSTTKICWGFFFAFVLMENELFILDRNRCSDRE